MKIRYLTVLLALITLQAFSQKTKKSMENGKPKAKKILFVVTSFGEMSNGTKTGVWAEEFTTPYYALLDKGVEITIATPKGGKAPIEPRSTTPDMVTGTVKRFLSDDAAQQQLNNTVLLSSVKAEDYDAVFYPGGHAPMWDLPENAHSIALIEAFVEQKKPMAFVCHSPVALKNVKTKDGEYLLKGKRITSYSNLEEETGQSTAMVPYPLESMLRERGGKYEKGEKNWTPYAVQDGLLITGQNPSSSELVAEKVLAALAVK